MDFLSIQKSRLAHFLRMCGKAARPQKTVLPHLSDRSLVVFTGLPGTGKSSVAEAVGRELGIPVFTKDWLESFLQQTGFFSTRSENLEPGYASYELLTLLALRQMELGQSVILDSVASTESIRNQWRDLALQFTARWRVIECICSDESVHIARLALRQRGIPGWHELAWSDVEKVKAYYAPWQEERLILDMVNPLQANIQAALLYLLQQ